MQEFLRQLLELIRTNPVLVAAGAVLAALSIFKEASAHLTSPVLRDVFLALVCLVALAQVLYLYRRRFMTHFSFARDRLNRNAVLYALGQSWKELVLALVAVAALCFVSFGPVSSLKHHAQPPYSAQEINVRLPPSCRICPQLLDLRGNQTGPTCVPVDPGGKVQLSLGRWWHYRAMSIRATCDDASSYATPAEGVNE